MASRSSSPRTATSRKRVHAGTAHGPREHLPARPQLPIRSGHFDLSSAYFDRFVYFRFDSTPILIFFGVPDLPAVTLQPEDSSIWASEARYSSNLSGPFNFVVGALYQRNTRSFVSTVVQRRFRRSRDGDSAGHLRPHLRETGGAGRCCSAKAPTTNSQWSAHCGPALVPFGRAPIRRTCSLLRWPAGSARGAHHDRKQDHAEIQPAYKVSDDCCSTDSLPRVSVRAARTMQASDRSSGARGFESDSLWNYELG